MGYRSDSIAVSRDMGPLSPPPPLAEESKPSPAQKVKKESPGESPDQSRRVLADPPIWQNESKMTLWSQKTGNF